MLFVCVVRWCDLFVLCVWLYCGYSLLVLLVRLVVVLFVVGDFAWRFGLDYGLLVMVFVSVGFNVLCWLRLFGLVYC